MNILCFIFSFMLAWQGDASLRQDVENYLKRQLKNFGKIEFEITSAPRLAGSETIRIDTARQLKVAGEIAYVPVNIVSGAHSAQSYLSLKVALYRNVLVARQPVVRGTEIKAGDYDLKLLNVARLRGNPVAENDNIEAMRSKFSLKEGEILVKENLQPIPLIHRGDGLIAVIVRGNVEISMDAVAREEGCPGDIIRVLTTDKKLFRAKVIDRYSVKIIE